MGTLSPNTASSSKPQNIIILKKHVIREAASSAKHQNLQLFIAQIMILRSEVQPLPFIVEPTWSTMRANGQQFKIARFDDGCMSVYSSSLGWRACLQKDASHHEWVAKSPLLCFGSRGLALPSPMSPMYIS